MQYPQHLYIHTTALHFVEKDSFPMTPLENILSYMVNFLERPHPVFANMPPCPYARKERIDNKILFQETPITAEGPSLEFLQDIRNFDSALEWTTMLAYAPLQEVDVQGCYAFAQRITDALTDIDILAIPLHPEDPFSVQGVRTREVPYVMMLIQRRAILSEAKEKLLNTKYYTNWTDKDYRIMSTLHKRLHDEGIFFPFLWWTDEVLDDVRRGYPFPEAVISSTVNLLTRNQTHHWMHKWGKAYGWKPLCSFNKWEKIREQEDSSIILATAHGGSEDGLTAILFAENGADAKIPLAYPALDTWSTKWPGGSYIWIYDEELLENAG